MASDDSLSKQQQQQQQNLSASIPKLEPRRHRPEPSNPTPFPETPTLPPPPPDISHWTFQVPTRRILTSKDHELFLSSTTCSLIKAWVFTLAESVVDEPCSSVKDDDLSDTLTIIVKILDEARDFLTLSPPDEQGGSRFGNKAFRGFLKSIASACPRWHRSLGLVNDEAMTELSTYLNQSFGNHDRIDYGSGHELNFLMWLLCLYQLGILHSTDFKPLILHAFKRYLTLMRAVQMAYYLEPAGSHGVWGLDDYQFLPFLFGAAQLLHHPYITPRAIHQDLTIEEFSHDYLYLSQVSFVNSTKTVKGLRWHSPMLDDISSAKSWVKIEGGMRRMFVAQILGKLPVMQHFLFGSLIPAVPGMSQQATDGHSSSSDQPSDHKHDGTGWSDCCGIKVPSSIAAAQETRKKAEGELRRIPFD